MLVHEQRRDGGQELFLRPLMPGGPAPAPERDTLARELESFRAGLRVREEVQQQLSPDDVEMLRRLGYVD